MKIKKRKLVGETIFTKSAGKDLRKCKKAELIRIVMELQEQRKNLFKNILNQKNYDKFFPA